MTIIRINAITVAEGGGPELERRFSNRAGGVDGMEGFEGFELLRPTDAAIVTRDDPLARRSSVHGLDL